MLAKSTVCKDYTGLNDYNIGFHWFTDIDLIEIWLCKCNIP